MPSPQISKPRIIVTVALYLGFLMVVAPGAGQASASRVVGLQILVVDSPTEADKALQRLKAGEDFAAVAKQISTDTTASDGGYMGQIDPGTLRPELRNALQGLSPGQITGIIHLSSGYAILKVLPPDAAGSTPTKTSTPQNAAYAATGTIRYAPNVGERVKPISPTALCRSLMDGTRT